jgi:hypothetical protein
MALPPDSRLHYDANAVNRILPGLTSIINRNRGRLWPFRDETSEGFD